MEFLNQFIRSVINPPSFSDWQTMNDVSDMVVTGTAVLFRFSAVLTLSITALGFAYLLGRFIWSAFSTQ